MADKTISERLQPSLLDRLTDEAPGELKERRDERVIDVRRLRDIVQRDLSWLLNTNSHETLLDPAAVPNVCSSVINYGVREVAGELSSVERAHEIRGMIQQAIERFEPRIRPGTLDVVLRVDKGTSGSIISYDIRAEMWAQPVPLELYLRSEVNVATGELKLEKERLTGPGMDTRLLKHYEAELAFMREMGAEFAEAYPKIAARLGMEGIEVLDPYVERLLEGFAFLAARVQLELEMQFPAFTAHLLEIVYPHYLAPLPSMMIAAFSPDPTHAGLKDGFTLARGTQLRSAPAEGEQTSCLFRTAHDVVLWPIEIAEAEYIDGRGELAAAGIGRGVEGRAALRLRFRRSSGGPIAELPIDSLTLFLGGRGSGGWLLHEALCAQAGGLTGRSTNRRADWLEDLPDGAVLPRGFERDEALLPTPRRSFDGYRLLQEYFAMPERFHFVELKGLAPAIRRAEGADIDIYILLRDGMPELASHVSPEAFTLYAVPAVNLFQKRCDRVQVSTQDAEQHLVPDRSAPLDFEIYALENITGISGEGRADTVFRPFYSQDDFTSAGETHPAYYTQRRRMRQRSERERLRGVRTSYLGSELYVSLVDRSQAPYDSELQQLAVTALCTNRDLPLLLSTGAPDVFHLPEAGPVVSVRTPVSPTRPRPTLAQGDAAWRLISHLSLNYLSIADTRMGGGAEALRELLGIYAPLGDRTIEKQLEGIASVTSRPIVRRMADEVLTTAVRGLEIRLDFDDSFFEGTSVYLLGAVLERFFRKYVSINSFTETVLYTQQRGEIARWKAASGLGRLI